MPVSKPTPHQPPRVAILVETSRTYGRELLAGIRRYTETHGPWSTFLELRAVDSSPPAWLRHWQGDGLLTRTFTPAMAKLVAQTGVPAVELRSQALAGDRPFVGVDNADIGRQVAEHFLDRGYQNFAVYSLHTEPFFRERVRNFQRHLAELTFACPELVAAASEKVQDWDRDQARLMTWLQALPKPVAVFAANDQLAVHLLAACQQAKLRVPDDVAVVGAENEEALCTFATPPLSSVRFEGEAIGFEAARILDQLMRGGQPPKAPLLFPPRGIVTRNSSDAYVLEDKLVARALRLIRSEAPGRLNVEELCRKLPASRTTLDRRMKSALGRTPKEEILRHRFREVERLLRETNLTIASIADQTGFTHSHYLQTAFLERYQVTPGRFRQAHPRV